MPEENNRISIHNTYKVHPRSYVCVYRAHIIYTNKNNTIRDNAQGSRDTICVCVCVYITIRRAIRSDKT